MTTIPLPGLAHSIQPNNPNHRKEESEESLNRSNEDTTEEKQPQQAVEKSRICGLCQQIEYKYTCPGCSIKTCSLKCSNEHKKEKKCTGKRNRVEYVKLNQFSWGKLMQDYTYLEDLHRLINDSRNSQSLKTSTTNTTTIANSSSFNSQSNRNISSKRNYLVRKAALDGVRLFLMADGMAKRKLNSTSYNKKKNCLQWSLEMVFPNYEENTKENEKQYNQLLHQVTSDTKLIETLKRTLSSKKTKLTQVRKAMLMKTIEEQAENIIFVIRKENFTRPEEVEKSSTSQQTEVYVIESNASLAEAINGTKVLEWPKIEVWISQEWTEQISSGKIKILPKESIEFHKFKSPVDAGWSNKKIKLNHSTLNQVTEEDTLIRETTESISSVDDPSIQNQESNSRISPPSNTLQNPQSIINSLLQYSSSENDSS